MRQPVIASSRSDSFSMSGIPDAESSSAAMASSAVWQARPFVTSRWRRNNLSHLSCSAVEYVSQA